MRTSKPYQTLVGLVFVLAGVLFFMAVLTASLSNAEEGMAAAAGKGNDSMPGLILVTAFTLMVTEIGLWITRSGLAMRKTAIPIRRSGPWAIPILWHIRQVRNVVAAIVLITAFAGGIALFGYILYGLAAENGLVIGPQSIAVVGTLAIYLLARRPLMAVLGRIGGRIKRALRRTLPRYTLDETGINIDLNWRKSWTSSEHYCVRIDFEEMDEVRELTQQEAVTLPEYELTPSLELLATQTRDSIRFMRGEIARPAVYTSRGDSSVGKTVLMRGPNLFYIVTFDADSVDDLLAAFQASRSSIPAALSGHQP